MGGEESDKRQDEFALKYLDMARSEILDRMKLSNQTLTVYVGAVGAIAAWMYQASIGSEHLANLRALAFPTGVVVAFLALAATWIIFHNERMVNALALYQKKELAEYLTEVAPRVTPWEASKALHCSDGGFGILITILVQGILVIGPNLVFLGAMRYLIGHPEAPPTFETPLERPAIWLTGGLTMVAIFLTCLTILDRRKLRHESRDQIPRCDPPARNLRRRRR